MQQGPRQRGCLLDPRRGSSQGVLLGAQSLDPTEVRGSSPLDRAEPGGRGSRHVQTDVEALWLKTPRRDPGVERKACLPQFMLLTLPQTRCVTLPSLTSISGKSGREGPCLVG